MLKKIRRYITIIKTQLELRWEYRKEFSSFKRVIRLAERMMEDKDNGLVWDENDYFSGITIVFIATNLHRSFSILVLCRKGFAKDAVILLRSMFEELIDYKYLHQNKNRAEDFVDYDYRERLRLGKILLNSSASNIDRQKVQKRSTELETEWNKVKHRFRQKNGKPCRRWNCLTIEETANAVDLGETYGYMFGYLSAFTHTSMLSANEFVLGKDDKGVVVEIGTSKSFIQQTLPTASAFLFDILEIANEVYNLGYDEEFEEIKKRLESDKVATVK